MEIENNRTYKNKITNGTVITIAVVVGAILLIAMFSHMRASTIARTEQYRQEMQAQKQSAQYDVAERRIAAWEALLDRAEDYSNEDFKHLLYVEMLAAIDETELTSFTDEQKERAAAVISEAQRRAYIGEEMISPSDMAS